MCSLRKPTVHNRSRVDPFGMQGGGTKHTYGRKTSYWSAMRRAESYPNSFIGQFGLHCNSLVHLFLAGRMFSRWIITNITSTRGTLHCSKIRIPCGGQLVICGL
jgi:hypothetical protein